MTLNLATFANIQLQTKVDLTSEKTMRCATQGGGSVFLWRVMMSQPQAVHRPTTNEGYGLAPHGGKENIVQESRTYNNVTTPSPPSLSNSNF